VSRGGSSDMSNLRPVCRSCNSIRGNRVGEALIQNIMSLIKKSDLCPKKLFIIDDINNGFTEKESIKNILIELESTYLKNKSMLEAIRFSK
jgi:hypothetical protein